MLFRARRYQFCLDYRVLIVGVLNVTPDSFSDGGLYLEPRRALRHAREMVTQGADILDIGAESTRPGAAAVPAAMQLKRLVPVIRKVRRSFPRIPISIDTTDADVAQACLEEGADLINDTSGLLDDERMGQVVSRFRAGLILMHRRGRPEVMQSKARYRDVVGEIIRELRGSLRRARAAGIKSSFIAVDPGLGFSKTARHNLEILNQLKRFAVLKRPVCVGPSRKSFLGKITGRNMDARGPATDAAVALAVEKGARLVRVHDAAAARDVVQVTQAILKGDV